MNSTAQPITTAQVRRVLKKAGLNAAKRFHSNNIKGGFTSTTANGWALSQEREYRRKQWHQTGRVVVDFLANHWNLQHEEALNRADMQTAREALEAAGFTVSTAAEFKLLVSR